MKEEIKMIPIERIRILNPRHRGRKKFEEIVQSIKNIGLKKPIKVSLRSEDEPEGPGYDLVCGQGRIEAFMVLGHKEIPAIVVEIPKIMRLLSSLGENMARKQSNPLALIDEINRLSKLGYSNNDIAEKLGVHHNTVGGLLALSNAGEERLLEETLMAHIPLDVAMEIAKTDSPETQRELLKAYESKQLDRGAIRTVKRVIDQRRLLGKKRNRMIEHGRKNRTSAESLVNAYRRETQKQQSLIKKAKHAEEKLLFVETVFGKLFADENFMNLLRAEGMANVPKFLWEKISSKLKEAA